MIGDLFVFDSAVELDVEWLVVRQLDEEPIMLVVPGDSYPQLGPADVPVPGRPLWLRCGQAIWVPKQSLDLGVRVGQVTEDTLKSVKGVIAGMARGTYVATAEQEVVDSDPEYQEHLQDVNRVRLEFQDTWKTIHFPVEKK